MTLPLRDTTIHAGDFVVYEKNGKHYRVEEVFGDCAWVMDTDGGEEWVPLSQLDKVRL